MEPETLMAVGFLSFFILLIGLMFWMARRQNARIRDVMFARGLVAVKPVDPDLLERVRGLHAQARLSQVYRLNRAAYQFFIFELDFAYSRDGESSSQTQAAVQSGDLCLPRLVLIPSLKLPVIGGWVEKILQGALARNDFVRVTFPEHPTFDENYLLLGPDEAALRQFFTLERLNRLAELKNFTLDGLGDLLIFSRFDPQVRGNLDDGHLSMLQDGASALFAVFRE
jgi:hypothetical protein